MESIWKKDVRIHERKPLQQEGGNTRQVDTLVIGAGMAGILTAYFLRERGREVLVVDANRIAGGQTEKTTAKITSQHGMIYDKLLRKCGRKRALDYARANEEAIALYEEIIKEEKIPCYFERCSAYLYTTCEEGIEKLKKEAKAAASLGIDSCFLDTKILEWDLAGEYFYSEAGTEVHAVKTNRMDKSCLEMSDVEINEIIDLPFKVKAAVCFENQAQFHPLEFIRYLAAKLEILENTKVLSVKKHMVHTDKGNIHAENIVFATHYPFVNVPGFYFLRQHQERSYVLALQGEGVPDKLAGMYYGIDKGGISLRSAGGKLLFGGGGHRTGSHRTGGHRTGSRKPGKCSVGTPQCPACEEPKRKLDSDDALTGVSGYSYLRRMKQLYYPDATEYTAWSAQDCMPHDELPFIGRYSVCRPYWYVATGFHKWGMTSSMIAARIICDMIDGKENPYQKTFSPQRLLLRAGISNLCKDLGESVAGLTKGLFSKKNRRCRHMGCRLNWNPEEESWDCPCHGSRFGKDGKLVDNPAQRDLK